MHIDRVWHSIPKQLARSVDGSAKRFQFTDITPGIDRYTRLANAFDWLNATGLTLPVPILETAKQALSAFSDEKKFKLFNFDVTYWVH